MHSQLPGNYDVLGIGAACIDLLIQVSEDFLKHVPGKKGGAEPIQKEELSAILTASQQAPWITTGGSSANVIKCLAMLGESCGFLTTLGHDAFGDRFIESAKKQKIHGLFSYSPLPTSCVLCLITPDGQRTMRFYEGSNLTMTGEIIQPEYFHGIKLLHIDSYSLRRPGLVEKAMQLAKQQQALISLDLSSFEIVQEKSKILEQLLKEYVDIVFGNADETLALTGLLPQEGCFELQKLCKVAVVMIGKEGCIVGHKNQLMPIPAYPANVVDTTGAGDFFAGGFLHGYLRNNPLIECAELGNRWGSAVVQVIGAEFPS